MPFRSVRLRPDAFKAFNFLLPMRNCFLIPSTSVFVLTYASVLTRYLIHPEYVCECAMSGRIDTECFTELLSFSGEAFAAAFYAVTGLKSHRFASYSLST